jgi:hypothetical protein
MWLIHQLDSFLNLGICKEYPIMPKAKTVRAESVPTQPTEISLVPEVKEARKVPTPINLEEEIRRRAYELYEQGGYVSGRENENWLAAEREVRARYNQRQTA